MKYDKDKWCELREIMQAHKEADQLVQGQWWENGRGCFYGCATHTSESPIKKAIDMYDLPPWIAYWSEKVFEGLPTDEALKWPVQLLDVMLAYEGDFEHLRHELAIKRLTYLLPTSDSKLNKAIQQAIDYHKEPDEEKRIKVEATAESAWSATWSASWSATEATAWQRERDWLLELMK